MADVAKGTPVVHFLTRTYFFIEHRFHLIDSVDVIDPFVPFKSTEVTPSGIDHFGFGIVVSW